MSDVVELVLSQLREIVSDLIVSWEGCEDNIGISNAGNYSLNFMLHETNVVFHKTINNIHIINIFTYLMLINTINFRR